MCAMCLVVGKVIMAFGRKNTVMMAPALYIVGMVLIILGCDLQSSSLFMIVMAVERTISGAAAGMLVAGCKFT